MQITGNNLQQIDQIYLSNSANAINCSITNSINNNGFKQTNLQTISSKIFNQTDEQQNCGPSVKNALTKNSYEYWRGKKDDIDMSKRDLTVDITQLIHKSISPKQCELIQTRCLHDYFESNQAFEKSVADVALSYVRSKESPMKKGPLLSFSNKLSRRYLDLYRGFINFEMSQGLPMLSNAAGQMKNHGFKTQEILDMKDGCSSFMKEFDKIKEKLLCNKKNLSISDAKIYDEFRRAMLDDKLEKEFLIKYGNSPDSLFQSMVNSLQQVNTIGQKQAIRRAYFMMDQFAHMSLDAIEIQLNEVAHLTVNKTASLEERLIMEIRHRIGGDGSTFQSSPGSLGQNPLAYLNVILNGEPTNPEAEFRNQMYFVYMSNHFANRVMENSQAIDAINDMLNSENKGWQIDVDFVEAMNEREAKYLPPVFRYGNQAGINRYLREMLHPEEMGLYYKSNPSPTAKEAVAQQAFSNLNANFRYHLSPRELVNQFGDWEPSLIDLSQQVKFSTGAALFKLYKQSEIINDASEKSKAAQKYTQMVEELKIPVAAGISGTLDQSTTMAALVGIGLGKERKKKEELEEIRLAYLAFMVPNSDHTVHEIMQSSKSFGLDYLPGPGYENQIYPKGGKEFIEQLEKEQKRRGFHLPSYYLSAAHIKNV